MLQVLIVDDMDIVRKEIKRLKLWGEKSGFIISGEAKNGYEALEELCKSPADMVITDIRMPKVDGIELLKRIMEKRLCPCVILLSDHCEFKYAREGLVLGAFDYITKPVEEAAMEKLLLRAKEFILNKKYEQQRIKQLEKNLEEKVEVFFPQYEVARLTETINAGDEQAVSYADHMASMIFAKMDQNIIKAESLLSSILNEVKKEIIKSHPWLDKFISIKEIGEVDFSRVNEPEAVKSAFVSAVKSVVSVLTRLKYCAREKGIVDQVCNYVLENIDKGISLTTAADSLFLNKSYVSGVFKQKTDMTFTEYLTYVKMERAKKLIQDGRLKIYEIAELLDFNDIEYFSRLFKKHSGLSPSEYRHKLLQGKLKT